MELELIRRWQGNASTLSTLKIDGNAQHFILEDKDRGLAQDMPIGQVQALKIKKETAIPTGRYLVVVDYSNRFKRLLPRLVDVPGFEGIRIHPGNRIKNTEGCLLPGVKNFMEDKEYCVAESRTAFERIFAKINQARAKEEKVWITIRVSY